MTATPGVTQTALIGVWEVLRLQAAGVAREPWAARMGFMRPRRRKADARELVRTSSLLSRPRLAREEAMVVLVSDSARRGYINGIHGGFRFVNRQWAWDLRSHLY